MQTDRSSSHGSSFDTALPDQAFGVPLTRLKRWLKSLRVSRKISLGYAIALGVAIAGTATGVALGDRYQRRAEAKEAHVQAEIKILHRLQTSLLRARNRQQQLIPLVDDPEQFRQQYARLRMDAAAVRSHWLELELFLAQVAPDGNSHDQRTLGFIQRNQTLPEEYFKQLDRQVSQLNLGRSPSAEAVRAAQQELLDFTNSPIALQIDQLSNAMIGLELLSDDENAEVSQAQFTADDLRLKIIVLSMALSAAIAAILAMLISRLITRPLDAVTKVARQATQDSNFELRAPVTTDDEVGALANSLNQLIQRVGELLEEQRATVAQQLVQTEKMSSLGQMVAGVAHEINNPVNFIYGNLTHASQYIDDLFELIDIYKAELTPVPAVVQAKETAIEFDFLKDDLPKLLQSMQVGADRARQIVLSLRNFSRLDEEEAHSVDIHGCLDSTLLILNNRLKNAVTVVRNYGNLPPIEGYAGSLYQVFANIVGNAIDALQEIPRDLRKITITTERLGSDRVTVRIADNGSGIPIDCQEKIFETFFTTKPVGVGTGLGLSISRQIIAEKHAGHLSFKSEVGVGTEFLIVLPVTQMSLSVAPVGVMANATSAG